WILQAQNIASPGVLRHTAAMNRCGDIRTEILAPVVAGAMSRACADAVSARLVGCGHADAASAEAQAAAELLMGWEAFLSETRQSTRYNGVRRFRARAADIVAGVDGDWGGTRGGAVF